MISLLDPVTVNFESCDVTFIIKALQYLLSVADSMPSQRVHCLTRMLAIIRLLRSNRKHRESFMRIQAELKDSVRLLNRRDWSDPAKGMLKQVLSVTVKLSASVCSWLRNFLDLEIVGSDRACINAKYHRYGYQNQLLILHALSFSPNEEYWPNRFRRLLEEARIMFTKEDLSWFIQAIPVDLVLRLDENCVRLLRRHHWSFLGGDEQRQRMLNMRIFPHSNDALIHDTVYLDFLSRATPQLGECNDILLSAPISRLHEAYGEMILCCLSFLTSNYFHTVRRRPTLAIAPLLACEQNGPIRFHLTPTINFTLTGIMLKRAFQFGIRLPFHFDGHTIDMFRASLSDRRALISLHARDLKPIKDFDSLTQTELRYLDRLARFDGNGLHGFHHLMTASSVDTRRMYKQVNLRQILLNRFKECLATLFEKRIFSHSNTWTTLFT